MLQMVVVGAVTAGLALAIALPASAHDSQINLIWEPSIPDRLLAHGGVNLNHTHVWICDDYADGLGVKINWRLRNGAVGSLGDGNGSIGGCGGAFPGSASNPIVTYWISRDRGPSSPPKTA
jgi:hypothetical protein